MGDLTPTSTPPVNIPEAPGEIRALLESYENGDRFWRKQAALEVMRLAALLYAEAEAEIILAARR